MHSLRSDRSIPVGWIRYNGFQAQSGGGHALQGDVHEIERTVCPVYFLCLFFPILTLILGLTPSCILPITLPHNQIKIFNNCSSSPNGLWVNGPYEAEGRMSFSLRGHDRERNNCFRKIQLVSQKYRDKTTLASITRFSRHCIGFQSRRFSLLVGYNI